MARSGMFSLLHMVLEDENIALPLTDQLKDFPQEPTLIF